MAWTPPTRTIDELTRALEERAYLADRGLATVLHLAVHLRRPLLLEGEAGVGKTEVAKVLTDVIGTRLIRLQCYEGIDAAQALYEWNYSRQLLHIRMAEATHERLAEADLFGPDFLLERPLLAALRHPGPEPAVLLIDEVDRADDEFEAFLLEVLSDFTVTVPEIGTISAVETPVVVVTSNRTREVHDALKRRCLYHWIDHPGYEREVAIVRIRAPQVAQHLAHEVTAAVQALRGMDLYKLPGVAETIDWAAALALLDVDHLDEAAADATLGTVLKYHEDQQRVRQSGLSELLRLAAGS
jgi:MoxR-like ATPase